MAERIVHLIDDEEAVRRSISFALKTSGYTVRAHASGADFLKSRDLSPCCILLDIHMPEMDGLAVQKALLNRGFTYPVIIITGHGDVSVAVQAMKLGASDFIEKPFQKAKLLSAMAQAFERLDRSDGAKARAIEARTLLHALTPRERDVLEGLARGLPNKTIGYDLGISSRTVEIHRANVMVKLRVNSLSEALRIAFAAGLGILPTTGGGTSAKVRTGQVPDIPDR